jgi:hypothetical protein
VARFRYGPAPQFMNWVARKRVVATDSLRCTADIQAVDATDSRGSASDSRVSDLTAGKLTPKLSVRIADVHGRQLPTQTCQPGCSKAARRRAMTFLVSLLRSGRS